VVSHGSCVSNYHGPQTDGMLRTTGGASEVVRFNSYFTGLSTHPD
jgi:hypothetical protein